MITDYSPRRRLSLGAMLVAAGLLCASACVHRGALPSRLEGVVPPSDVRPVTPPEEAATVPERPAEAQAATSAAPAPEPEPSRELNREAPLARRDSSDDFLDVNDKHWFKKSWPMALFLALLAAAVGVF